jgi:PAS domain S-box-containing protein
LSAPFIAAVSKIAVDSPNFRIVQEGRPVFQRYNNIDLPKSAVQREEAIRVIAVLPLLHRGHVVGCMNIASHASDEIVSSARMALETIAALAGGIIARAETEQALEKSEERYRAMFEHMGSGIAVYDALGDGEDFVYRDLNPRAQHMFSLKKEDVIGRSLLSLFPQLDRFGYLGALLRVVRTGQPEYLPPSFYKDERREGWWEGFLYRLPTSAVVAIFSDVTESKNAERALRDSEARLSSIFRAAPVGIGLVRERVLVQVNERLCEMVGRSADELIGQSARIMYPTQEDYEYVGREKYRQITERGSGTVETRWTHKNGSLIDVILSSTPLDPDDLLRGVTFTAVDITARKQAERELRQERDRARTYLDIAAVMFVVLDPAGRVTLINRIGCEILGCGTNEIIGRNWFDHFVPERQRDEARAVFSRLLRGEVEPVEYNENHVLTARGEEHLIAWHNTILRDSEDKIVAALSSGEDVTERRRIEQEKIWLEAHVRQQQKLESVGTLAAGVAHEINNPINGIMNYAQLIAHRLPEDEPGQRYAGRIVAECERVSAIVHNLLAFSRQDQQTHSPARIQDIVSATVSLLRALIRRDQIALEIDVPEDLPRLKCRSQQIQQVLLNLLTNSRDALVERFEGNHPDKRIRLTARRVEIEGRGWIRTSVEDFGGGIPLAIGERVFDPFFTTKPRDKGTGLGLAISYGIAKDHHGALWFESEAGRGTRFHLDLPLDNGWTLEERKATV